MRIHIIYQREPGGKTKIGLLPSREEIRRFVRNHKLGINDYALYANKRLIKNFKDTDYNIKENLDEASLNFSLEELQAIMDMTDAYVEDRSFSMKNNDDIAYDIIDKLEAHLKGIKGTELKNKAIASGSKKFPTKKLKLKEGKKMKKTLRDEIYNTYRFLNNEPVNEAMEVKFKTEDLKDIKNSVKTCFDNITGVIGVIYERNNLEISNELLKAMAKRKIKELLGKMEL